VEPVSQRHELEYMPGMTVARCTCGKRFEHVTEQNVDARHLLHFALVVGAKLLLGLATGVALGIIFRAAYLGPDQALPWELWSR
jgi:hypothetical protein